MSGTLTLMPSAAIVSIVADVVIGLATSIMAIAYMERRKRRRR